MVETVRVQSKIAKIGEKQRRTVKISPSYWKLVSLDPFPVTNLRLEVELMHLLRMQRHYRLKSRRCRAPEITMPVTLYRLNADVKSNMTLDFKRKLAAWSRLHMRSEKSPK